MELATAAQYQIGVKVLIFNNEFQGMVQQWQDLFYDQRYSHTRMKNPDFVKLAESMGVHAIRCDKHADLEAKMKEFLEYDGSKPVLMECLVEKAEHVFPMVSSIVSYTRSKCLTDFHQVPAGKALHEQLLHPNLREAVEKMRGSS